MEAAECGMVGPRRSQGLTIEFSDLKYKVNDKVVLNGVSGRFRPGHLSAVMGPSGAGKTSLLNILSGYTQPLLVEGSISLDGEPRDLAKLKTQSCYITQEFSMLTYLSVRESLQVAASLKLGPRIGHEKKNIVVDEVASTLGLVGVLDSQVHNLSGGEKKRLSIGLELVSNPPIIFCDEPTSGLDSFSSVQVIARLQSLARDGHTIIVAIHSPSPRLLEMIDDLLLLAEGRSIYNGSLNGLLPTLEVIGLSCPQYYNRADFALEVACKHRGDHIEELAAMAAEKHQKRTGSFFRERPPLVSEQVFTLTTGNNGIAAISLKEEGDITKSELSLVHLEKTQSQEQCSFYAAPRLTQFCVLFKRSIMCSIRDMRLGFLRIVTTALVALLIGVVYYDFGQDGAKLPSNFSCIFFIVMYQFYATAMHNVLLYPLEASVIVREHFNNWFALSMYYLAKILADLPFLVICPVIFVAITYYLTDQPMVWDRFLLFLLVNILLSILAQGLGCTFGVAYNPQVGIFLLTSCTMPMFLISGFFIHLDDLSPYVRWLSYISIFRYALEAAAYSIFGFNREPLKCSESICPYYEPEKFLQDMGLEDSDYWENIGMLCVFIVLSQIALFLTLTRRIAKSKQG